MKAHAIRSASITAIKRNTHIGLYAFTIFKVLGNSAGLFTFPQHSASSDLFLFAMMKEVEKNIHQPTHS